MKRKGILTILMAVFMVLAFSAMALAANQVSLKTTVPNIPKSTCYQAGTDTMEMDSLTALVEGDVITFTLNNKVTICKEINMFVTIGTQAGVLDLTGGLPVSTTAGAVNAAAAGSQWGFLVQGPVGSQIITLTLRQVTTAGGTLNAPTGLKMTFTGTLLTDKLVVKLFDGKVGVFATSGINKFTSAGVYNTAATANDNVLCIDTLTQDYQGEYVQNTPNSVPGLVADKLNFTGDYTIAHIMAAQTYNLVTCKGATCGNILLGTGGQSASCQSFNYETIGTGSNGYCSTHTASTGYLPKFIVQTSQPFDPTGLVPWTVTAEILVNGVAGAHGVYWSSTPATYASSNATTCGLAVGASAFAGNTYYLADGVTTAAIGTLVASGANNCAAVTAAKKAVKFVTTAGAIFGAGDLFFELNIPDFVYNLSEVNAGDVVSVKVTLSKATCGSVSFELCMGTFIASCPTAAGAGASKLCPYVTSLNAGDAFWNGLAIVNTSSKEGALTLTAVKSDGSANATFTTPSIPAGGMYVKLVSAIPWTGTTPAGIPAYITIQAPAGTIPAGGLDAFVMMADGAHNSMGYLCR